MARPKSVVLTPAEPAKRIRRTEEQLIQDLEAKIQQLKVKAETKAATRNPALKHTRDAIRSIDAALTSAANGPHKQALSEARTVLVAYLQLEGVKLPQRRGRKPGWTKSRDGAE